jgi:hypothetical protein
MDELQLGDPGALDRHRAGDRRAGPRPDRCLYRRPCRARRGAAAACRHRRRNASSPPTVLTVSGIAEMPEEIFGPVLHVATFRAGTSIPVIAAINASGYGLTFGLHTRIDARVEEIAGGEGGQYLCQPQPDRRGRRLAAVRRRGPVGDRSRRPAGRTTSRSGGRVERRRRSEFSRGLAQASPRSLCWQSGERGSPAISARRRARRPQAHCGTGRQPRR